MKTQKLESTQGDIKKQTLPSSKTSIISGSVTSNSTSRKEISNLKKNLQK